MKSLQQIHNELNDLAEVAVPEVKKTALNYLLAYTVPEFRDKAELTFKRVLEDIYQVGRKQGRLEQWAETNQAGPERRPGVEL